jgi:hypothetical protein
MDRLEAYFLIMLLTILTSEIESKLAMVRSIPTNKGAPVKKENRPILIVRARLETPTQFLNAFCMIWHPL